MSVYDLSALMAETRKLAANFRETTGQALPVTVELARFDAITLLGLEEVEGSDTKASLVTPEGEVTFQVKGRVIFSGKKARERVGQLNLDGHWDVTLLVIYDSEYNPRFIYQAPRTLLVEHTPAKNKRGSMTVAKFKAIGELVWHADDEQSS
ncbi:hypothetical protein [Pleionea sp. CnH1-48]|uniref:hypothetical protein n=1 Tax=Pleionea sp. CnH1-48 TaxID=2954494 RepID=UPI002096CC11|nr:hypothetical protein [Pleionea sp. CnH1-48]MCO7222825.1 hypothetical protein [Pleionea sp. CnH1-48]